MYILGVNISHHSSVCLLKDGDILFYLEEERVSKIKQHNPQFILQNSLDFPVELISEKKLVNYRIEMISISEILKFTKKIDCLIFASYGHELDISILNIIKDQIDNMLEIGKSYFYQEHHFYHACSAFYNSGFDRAVSIILDGGGFRDSNKLGFYELESVYRADYSDITKVSNHYSNFWYNLNYREQDDFVICDEKNIFSNTLSSGGIFNILCEHPGFPDESGKIMGLAPYGNENNVPEPWFIIDEETGVWRTDTRNIFKSLEERFGSIDIKNLSDADKKLKFSDLDGSDLAKKAQIETRDHTIRLIDKYTKITGEKNVVLSGGYFLNCTNNYQYLKRFPDLNFFVDPIAHDGGTAIGAAKYLWHKLTGDRTIRKLETLYLGS